MSKAYLKELGKRIDGILRDYRFHSEPLKSPIIRREIAAKIRAAFKETVGVKGQPK